ncbi:hypothetical protein [Solirhodobacter olei]|uniref:hypothetical protein n=1 Tax=Solirhodobacter olei TaxID=2493082 RepID=UPI000FD87FF3|nr:hypothetical protein [Solirhodobacter olei]
MAYAAVGSAFIEHAVTGVICGVASDDLNWVVQEVRFDGQLETVRYGQCNHPNLGLLKWAIWELLDGTLDDFQADVGPHKLVMDFALEQI